MALKRFLGNTHQLRLTLLNFLDSYIILQTEEKIVWIVPENRMVIIHSDWETLLKMFFPGGIKVTRNLNKTTTIIGFYNKP